MPINLDWINDIYAHLDKLNMSITSLIAIGVVLLLIFLFSVREAATWFFKIDALRRDVRKLTKLTTEVEGQLRRMQDMLDQKSAQDEKKEATHSGSFPITR